MAPVVVDFGRSRTERKTLALTRADKDRILQHFPEKIAVAAPGFGAQEYPLRPHVKAFLDAVQPPSVKMIFEVHGHGDDAELTAIENTSLKVLGVSAGDFAVGDTVVAYQFDASIEGEGTLMNSCKCQDGREGIQPTQQFRLVEIEIEISPGVGGLFEIDEVEIVVAAPCCCPPEVESEPEDEVPDTDDRAGKDRKKKKNKRRD